MRTKLVAVALLAAACTPRVEPSSSKPTTPRPAATPPQASPPPEPVGPQQQYALAQEHRVVVDASRGLYVAAGARYIDAPKKRSAAPGPALEDGWAVPEHLGGGFVFASESSLFHAATFLGPLKPMCMMPARVRSLQHGLDATLVTLNDDSRYRLSWPGCAPVGGSDNVMRVHARSDRVALWQRVDGRVFLTEDGGKTRRDVSATFRGVLAENLMRRGVWQNAFARLGMGDAAPEQVELADAAVPFARVGRMPELLKRVVTRGALLDDEHAIVAARGHVLVVPLTPGHDEARALSAPLVSDSCHAMRTAGDVLLVCPHEGLVLRHERGKRIVIDKAFEPGRFFSAGLGTLAYAGSCAPASDSDGSVACVRAIDRKWHAVRIDHEHVMRWIPRADGSSYALAEKGNVLVMGERKIELSSPTKTKLLSYVGSNPTFDRSWHIDEEALRVLHGGRLHVMSLADGEVATVKSAAGAWPRVIAFDDATKTTRQSDDFGKTWTDVASPPVLPRLRWTSCSEAGCSVGSWARLGWRKLPPVSGQTVPVAAPPLARAGDVPTLTCTAQGDAKETDAFAAAKGDKAGFNWAAYTPRVRAAAKGGRIELRSVGLFDLSGRVRRHRLPVAPPRSVIDGNLVALVPDATRDPEWLLVSHSTSLGVVRFSAQARHWPAATTKARAHGGAVALGGGALSIHTRDGWFDVRADGIRNLRYGATGDTVARAPDGTAALVALPGGGQPDDAQRAFVWRAGEAPIMLAPWSTVVPASDPACKDSTTDYRMVARTVRPWLPTKVFGGERSGETTLLLRWNEKRVCLEAAEQATEITVSAAPKGIRDIVAVRGGFNELDVRVVARFGKKHEAALLAANTRVGFHQPMTCALGKRPR